MSRLFTKIKGDIHKSKVMQSSEVVDVEVLYGSENDSKPLLNVKVFWKKGTDIPEVEISSSVEVVNCQIKQE